jgi:hypothetical protein
LGVSWKAAPFILSLGILIKQFKKNIMSTFETIIWWYGVILGSVATIFFYGLLFWMFIQYLKDKFKK